MRGPYAHVADQKQFAREQALKVKFAHAVCAPEYAYSRHRDGVVWAYHYDANSPTGVLSAAGCFLIDFADQCIAYAGHTSALSPTEGLNKSGVSAYC